MSLAASAAVFFVLAQAIPVPQGRAPVEVPPITTFAHYGPPQPVELSDIAFGSYQHQAVVVRADIGPLDLRGQYWMLMDGGASVVLILVGELAGSARELMGHRLQVTGLVRELVPRQDTCPGPGGRPYPESYCKDPELPPTPDLSGDRTTWPKWSITAWALSDAGEPGGRRKGALERSALFELLSAATLPEKDVRVSGRFCGARLCGDGLGAPPEPSAWAIDDEGTAVWVVGKPPQGKGWRLDASARSDTARWLEVTGRLVPCTGSAGARCLKAKTVVLVPRPGAASPPP